MIVVHCCDIKQIEFIWSKSEIGASLIVQNEKCLFYDRYTNILVLVILKKTVYHRMGNSSIQFNSNNTFLRPYVLKYCLIIVNLQNKITPWTLLITSLRALMDDWKYFWVATWYSSSLAERRLIREAASISIFCIVLSFILANSTLFSLVSVCTWITDYCILWVVIICVSHSLHIVGGNMCVNL